MRVVRWGLGLSLLVLSGCGEQGAGEEKRGVHPESRVAVVAAVKGQVQIRDGAGALRMAAPDTPLRRTDTLITAPGAGAVVVLDNKYVLEIPGDQETPVRSLAHLEDPPAHKSLEQMLQDALGSSEFLDKEGKLVRIAGVNQLLAAGEAPAPVSPPAASEAPASAGVELHADRPAEGAAEPLRGDVSGDAAPSVSDAKTVGKPQKKKDPDSPTPPPPPASRRDVPETDEVAKKPKVDIPDPEKPAEKPKVEEESKTATPSTWTRVQDGTSTKVQGLPPLLKSNWDALAPCLAGAVELRLEVEGGRVKAVEPVACGATLIGKELPEAKGAATVVVAVK